MHLSAPELALFYCPTKEWCKALAKNAKIWEHISRFQSGGAYGEWITKGQMNDYIILNFGSSHPKKPSHL
jgi:hypothetical protein